jgi:type II secretory pathway pseudopilin PulG
MHLVELLVVIAVLAVLLAWVGRAASAAVAASRRRTATGPAAGLASARSEASSAAS